MSNYKAKDIKVLEGLDPVRRRPGMYIGSTSFTGLHHLVWEILDNAVDEALNGFCNLVEIILEDDGGITIQDNGRGLPVDKYGKTNKSAMEILLTTLHSGGKFDSDSYKVSGGLHGVGMAVVCALSEKLTATSYREGFKWSQSYSRGKPTTKLKKGLATKQKGTSVYFKPDPKIFSKVIFNFKLIQEQAESKAFLNKGLKIRVYNKEIHNTFHFKEGIKDYIKRITINTPAIIPNPIYLNKQDEIVKLEVAFIWTSKTESSIYSFANSIRTVDGGTHETGFKNGVTKALKAYIERRKIFPKGVSSITGDDAREGLVAIISVYLQGDIEFQGQTKGRLNSDISSQVDSAVKHSLEHFLHDNQTIGDKIANRVLLATQARIASRQAKEAVHRKTAVSHRLNLPGKLSDCSSVQREDSELFICEGDSAGGSSKQARDRKTQAILPIRGKILNVETANALKIMANAEIQNIVTAIGTGIQPKFNYDKLRYGKIIIMTDADVDGAHISALLLTFFYRFMPELISKGHLFIAQPPLYRIDVGKKAYYALDEKEKENVLSKLNGSKYEIGRFKGLGEMPAEDLKSTTMDRKSRSLICVKVTDDLSADNAFDRLMGKEAQHRFQFINERAAFFQDIDI